jgi:Flp pilus assembly protein TadG
VRARKSDARLVRGSAMVELALSAAIFFPLLIGTMQFGYSFSSYNKLENAIRAGARYAALRTYDSATNIPSDAFAAAVKNVVLYANPNGGTTPVVSGMTADQIVLSVAMYNGTPDMITVKLTSFQIDAAVAKITISGKPWATYRYQGRYAPP